MGCVAKIENSENHENIDFQHRLGSYRLFLVRGGPHVQYHSEVAAEGSLITSCRLCCPRTPKISSGRRTADVCGYCHCETVSQRPRSQSVVYGHVLELQNLVLLATDKKDQLGRKEGAVRTKGHTVPVRVVGMRDVCSKREARAKPRHSVWGDAPFTRHTAAASEVRDMSRTNAHRPTHEKSKGSRNHARKQASNVSSPRRPPGQHETSGLELHGGRPRRGLARTRQ